MTHCVHVNSGFSSLKFLIIYRQPFFHTTVHPVELSLNLTPTYKLLALVSARRRTGVSERVAEQYSVEIERSVPAETQLATCGVSDACRTHRSTLCQQITRNSLTQITLPRSASTSASASKPNAAWLLFCYISMSSIHQPVVNQLSNCCSSHNNSTVR